jgi:hypothetical protein
MRAIRQAPNLRRESLFSAVRRAIRASSAKFFRVVHFSVQVDHLHVIVESADTNRLSRGVAGLAIRVARAVNALLGRKGRLWGDRYHARALRSPREVRHALVYVLTNWRKHVKGSRGLDPCSSAGWFDGWKELHSCNPPDADAPVQPPSTWLAAKGWRRHGLLGVNEAPDGSRN